MKSQNLQNLLKEYRPLKIQFLIENPKCLVGIKGCKGDSSEPHHMAGSEGVRKIMTEFWLPVCRVCHTYITEHSAWAIENGYSLPRGCKEVTRAVYLFKLNR